MSHELVFTRIYNVCRLLSVNWIFEVFLRGLVSSLFVFFFFFRQRRHQWRTRREHRPGGGSDIQCPLLHRHVHFCSLWNVRVSFQVSQEYVSLPSSSLLGLNPEYQSDTFSEFPPRCPWTCLPGRGKKLCSITASSSAALDSNPF